MDGQKLGRLIGMLTGCIVTLCLNAILIALTVKFINWII